MILRLKQRIASCNNVDPVGATFFNGSDACFCRSGMQACYAVAYNKTQLMPRRSLATLSVFKKRNVPARLSQIKTPTNELKNSIKKSNKIKVLSPTTPSKFTNEMKDRLKIQINQSLTPLKNRMRRPLSKRRSSCYTFERNKNISFS